MCNCRANGLGFSIWEPFLTVAGKGNDGFGDIPKRAGVYSVRVCRCEETDPAKIIEKYCRSTLFEAFKVFGEASNLFFESCGLDKGWGWRWYETDADKDVQKIKKIPGIAEGNPKCPILYIGCSKSLFRRMQQFMQLAHPINHPLWALLYSSWSLEIAFRETQKYQDEEKTVKAEYRDTHEGRLPPLMAK